jgi:hypothetical protein
MKIISVSEYIAPHNDLIILNPEQGFAQSGSTESFDEQNGGWEL